MFQRKMKLSKHRVLSMDELPELKERKSGIIYFQTLPPHFTVSRMRDEMSRFGEIGRIYLQVNFLLALEKHSIITQNFLCNKNHYLLKVTFFVLMTNKNYIEIDFKNFFYIITSKKSTVLIFHMKYTVGWKITWQKR